MDNPRFQIQVGGAQLDSQVPSNLNSVAEVYVEQEINSLANCVQLTLGLPDGLQITSADQLANVASVSTASLSIRRGDPINIGLGYADELISVFSGEVDEVVPGVQQQQVKSLDAARKLQALRINQTYEQQTAGEIVADLATRAGVQIAEKEAGIEFFIYVIDDFQNGFEHILELATKIGFDFYVNVDNQLVFVPLTAKPAIKTFRYGIDVLQLEVFFQNAAFEKVEVRGESPTSSQGIEKSHWLVKSFEDSLGVAGIGPTTLHIQDPAIKTKAVADAVADGVFKGLKAKAVRGHLKTLGAPEIHLGDIIEIADFPNEALNGSYQVRKIQHLFNQHQGFVSTFHFTGLGNT